MTTKTQEESKKATSKHTPGPWYSYDPHFLGIAVAVRGEQPGSSRIVADVSEGREATNEDRANAELIAAAPEMLEEHRRSLEVFERLAKWLDDTGLRTHSDLIASSIKATRGIIAKAEGQS